jgi:hypothetical protein
MTSATRPAVAETGGERGHRWLLREDDFEGWLADLGDGHGTLEQDGRTDHDRQGEREQA